MNTNHTSGKWKASPAIPDPHATNLWRSSVFIDGTFIAADVRGTSETECNANAQLIALAPSLLAQRDALKAALRALRNFNDADPSLYDGDDGTLRRIMMQAQDALALVKEGK